MDAFAHGLWTYVVYRREPHLNMKFAVLWGVFPDVAIVIGEVFSLVTRQTIAHSIHDSLVFFLSYATTHSLIIFAFAFLLVRVLTGKWSKEMLAWPFHIFIDMVGHIDNLTPFLFPISKITMPPIFSWENRYILILNYLALGMLFLILPVFNELRKKI